MEDGRARECAEEVECGRGKFSFTYLGLPLGGNPRLNFFWTPVIEKMERRLEGWGRKYFSLGGRLTLINSVLTNLLMYYLSLFELPKGVANKMETLVRKFPVGKSRGKKERFN